jgi:hypothetical protein
MRWSEFAEVRPDLAEAGKAMFYPFGNVGLAFLATVRKDGGPRVHPMCPVLHEDNLYAFIEPGPKRYDLLRDGRYALHTFPRTDNEDAFYVTGGAERRTGDIVDAVSRTFWTERGRDEPPVQAHATMLFEFSIERCLLTRTKGFGDWEPQHTIWRA